jgi:hypothetical protein
VTTAVDRRAVSDADPGAIAAALPEPLLPGRPLGHADGSVTFTKAHRDECPFITGSGTQDCDDECDVDDPTDARQRLGR